MTTIEAMWYVRYRRIKNALEDLTVCSIVLSDVTTDAVLTGEIKEALSVLVKAERRIKKLSKTEGINLATLERETWKR